MQGRMDPVRKTVRREKMGQMQRNCAQVAAN